MTVSPGEIQKVAHQSVFFRDFIESINGAALIESGYLAQATFQAAEFERKLVGRGQIDVAQFDAQLRDQRHWEMARIIFRDQSRRSDLVTTTADLSSLADTCLQVALDFHFSKLASEWGEPEVNGVPQNLCVLALGKLGAFELNLSSDIDLIFFYDEPGTLPGGRSFQEYYLKLARSLIRSLDEIGPNGNVFRVDMRLRPYGDSGNLVLSRAAMEKYYLEQGRDWERYAFIKARAAAGDIQSGEAFLKSLIPFVYRKHIDYGALDSLREMKATIDQEVKRKALQDDVKLGPGGIREVEFIVQSQQLIWGGIRPEFRQRRLLENLEMLGETGLMPADCIHQLKVAYVFLRNLEHAIQAEHDRQTQSLPKEPSSQDRIASAMGFETYEACLNELNVHRGLVRAVFSDLMTASEAERETLLEGNLIWQQIWQTPGSTEANQSLKSAGFQETDQLGGLLLTLQRTCSELESDVVQQLNKLMPLLLYLSSREKAPDTALIRMFDLVSAIVRRSTYVLFLNENLDACYRVVRLCAMSDYVAEQMIKYPILLYTLTDAALLEGDQGFDALASQLDTALAGYAPTDLEGRMDALRTFKHGSVLQVGIHELLGETTIEQASVRLSTIAELILSRAVILAKQDLVTKYGRPGTKDGAALEIDFAVVAYGKLGSLELGYGSDLDLVFVHGEVPEGETQGEKQIHNRVFYQRLGQRVVHLLTTLTRFGNLYEIDLRLRPDGNSGPLVISMSAYARYLQDAAWTWEQQALVRARMVVGSEGLGEDFEALRGDILSRRRTRLDLMHDVTTMRSKMREVSASPQDTDEPELKQDQGGLVDIEFLVQFLVLLHAADTPALTRYTDNIAILTNLVTAGHLNHETGEILKRALIAYREATHFRWLGLKQAETSQLASLKVEVKAIWAQHFDTSDTG